MQPPIVEQVNHPDDLKKLHEITNRILGQHCTKAWVGYGEELKLEFGQPRQDWRLRGRGSDWILYAGQEEITSSKDTVENADTKLALLTNVPVVSFETTFPDLSLLTTFGNDMRLQIISEYDENYPRLCYWELFTPGHMYLEVGPKSQWRFRPSNVPMNKDNDPYYERR